MLVCQVIPNDIVWFLSARNEEGKVSKANYAKLVEIGTREYG